MDKHQIASKLALLVKSLKKAKLYSTRQVEKKLFRSRADASNILYFYNLTNKMKFKVIEAQKLSTHYLFLRVE
jgi:hypothetical protein